MDISLPPANHDSSPHLWHVGHAPYPVHRLDMMTSGVLVMAKRQLAAAPLAGQFR